MKNTKVVTAAWIGGVTSIPIIALSYLGQQMAELPMLPFDFFDWMSRVLPGGLITVVIDTMVSIITALQLGPTSEVAKAIEQTLAMFTVVAMGVVAGIVLAVLGRRQPSKLVTYGLEVGVALFAVFLFVENALGFRGTPILISMFWLLLLLVGWGAALGWLIQRAGSALADEPDSPMDRRAFIKLVGGGVVTISVGSWGIAQLLERGEPTQVAETAEPERALESARSTGPAASPSEEELSNRIQPSPGTRPELTPNDDFYRIDINTRPPRVDEEEWTLELSGLVENELSLTLEEIRSMPSVTQIITLSCISNRVGGDLIGTSAWTGVPFRALLERAGLQNGAVEIAIEAADGFYESVSMEDAMDGRTLLVYEMNGQPLPVEHGFPLRVYIPNRYGMKQPKWITRMEVIAEEGAGYWVDRGWSEEAYVKTVSVVDTVADEASGEEAETIPVGGIAWAGARGISKVEVQVDDGPWQEAELRTPPLSPLTWVQWVYDWPAETGSHIFKVRAYDGNGELQIAVPSDPHPDGASGIHSLQVTI